MVASKYAPDDPTVPWDVLELFPRQGDWTEDEYFLLNRLTNRGVELTAGRVEVLEMPTKTHQKIIAALVRTLEDHCRHSGGEVVGAPYPLRTSPRTYREPDVLVALPGNVSAFTEDFAERADLVFEVISQDRHRDLVTKRHEYALAGVKEYYLVDPREKTVTLLSLRGDNYVETIVARPGESIASKILAGFVLAVSSLPF